LSIGGSDRSVIVLRLHANGDDSWLNTSLVAYCTSILRAVGDRDPGLSGGSVGLRALLEFGGGWAVGLVGGDSLRNPSSCIAPRTGRQGLVASAPRSNIALDSRGCGKDCSDDGG